MRVVVMVVAALMTLGLAAFGVVAAQRSIRPEARLAIAARQTRRAIVASP